MPSAIFKGGYKRNEIFWPLEQLSQDIRILSIANNAWVSIRGLLNHTKGEAVHFPHISWAWGGGAAERSSAEETR